VLSLIDGDSGRLPANDKLDNREHADDDDWNCECGAGYPEATVQCDVSVRYQQCLRHD
jgi:hypothetical protein